MAGKTLVETYHGKRSKYEIYRSETMLSYEFTIYKDGKHWKSGYKDLRRALEVAREDS